MKKVSPQGSSDQLGQKKRRNHHAKMDYSEGDREKFKIKGMRDPVKRFWARVKIGGPDECWEWTGADRCEDGRGKFKINHRFVIASRFSWEIANKRKIPAGMLACHTCDNPPCCNPAHIWLGTVQDNADDMVAKGRSARGLDASRTKLTPEAVDEIRTTYVRGSRTHGGPSLARKFGVRSQSIYLVLYGVNWKYHK